MAEFARVVNDGKYIDVRHARKTTQRWKTETMRKLAQDGNKWAQSIMNAAELEWEQEAK